MLVYTNFDRCLLSIKGDLDYNLGLNNGVNVSNIGPPYIAHIHPILNTVTLYCISLSPYFVYIHPYLVSIHPILTLSWWTLNCTCNIGSDPILQPYIACNIGSQPYIAPYFSTFTLYCKVGPYIAWSDIPPSKQPKRGTLYCRCMKAAKKGPYIAMQYRVPCFPVQ